ncbi:hypothetical protein [Streptomyces wuyuanensis]|uniref:hypothetical protein n=1 Tax=Streptomyces wuyuanensis TaxID=1196353 RepID=UPI00343B023C
MIDLAPLQLGPPAGRALFRIDTAELQEWLALAHSVVAPGDEASYVDWQPLERLITDHGTQ